jgi:hypothetical protein
MAGKNTAVFGIYKSSGQAERAVDQIAVAGFSHNDISVLMPDSQSSKEFAHEKNTKAPEGTAAGVTTGGAVGGALGLLAGIGALAIPGVGPFIAAGPIMGALAGLGTGWDGDSRVRGEALRRPDQRWWRAVIRALRHFRRNHQSQRLVETYWS